MDGPPQPHQPQGNVKNGKTQILAISLSKHQSLSESVCLFLCLFVCLFPNSSETTKPDELKF